MPRYVRPKTDAPLERALNAFGNASRVAIIGYLAKHGSSTRGEVARGLDIGVATAKHNLQLLAEDGVVSEDPPASEGRSGMRVRYSLVMLEVKQRYAELGQALGLDLDEK